MGTDVFYFHGYTSIFLNGKWVKATPAFNIELCQKFGLRPLEFDGLEDSLYIAKGELAKSNAEQVAKIKRIIEDLSLTVATPAEARERLALKGGDMVGF